MGLRQKFNLMVGGVFLVGIAISGGLMYWITQRNAQEEVLQEARILYEAALAIRGYTANEIAPLLLPMIEEQFLPHTIASFAAQYNFRTMQQRFPDYSYKEAALNPTNLNDMAKGWEAEVIETFMENRDITEKVIVRTTDQGEVLTLAHPIVIENQVCLRCHGAPDDAPRSMLALYGTENGFGWKLGDVIGAQLVSVPTDVPKRRAWEHFGLSMAMVTGVFVVILVALNIGLNRIVIRPLKRMSTVADEVSLGNLDAPEFTHESKDEVGSLSESFNRMRRSLASALKMIDGI